MGDAVWDQRAPHRRRPQEPLSPVGSGRLIRVTAEADAPVSPRMMSDRANAYIDRETAFVFCGTVGGPRMFSVDLQSGGVTYEGPLPFSGETEGWYWTPDGRIGMPFGSQLLSVDPFDLTDVRVLLDINDMPGHDLWQPHSSDDGRTHSATVREIVNSGPYPYIGTVIQGPHGRRFESARGRLDESQVTRDGSHVVIKQNGEDNRIITLATGEAWDLADGDGAIGHSDCGPGFIVGESNLPGPGRCVKLDLHTHERTDLFVTDNMGYVSVRGGMCLHSGDTHLSLVALDGSGVMPLIEHGGGSAYDDRVKASLDPTGRVATFMRDGAVYLLEMP